MDDSQGSKFPQKFGTGPEDFLQRYESLIYKILYEQILHDPRFEVEDLFNDFFIHIAEDNFRRLRSFRGDSQPTTYLGRVLRNFLCDQFRKKKAGLPADSLDEMIEENGKALTAPVHDPLDMLAGAHMQEVFGEIFSQLSTREKLVFDLSTNEEMPAGEIATLLGIAVKSVYKSNEKIKKIFKNELQKRGIEDI
jgi:RNA polymerase sigma factor (sigma-70 family)